MVCQLWILKEKYSLTWTPLTRTSISRLERTGKRAGRWPSDNALHQLCQFYGVTPNVIYPLLDDHRARRGGKLSIAE
jgi:hypothetical protein